MHWLSRSYWLPDEESTSVNESSIQASHKTASLIVAAVGLFVAIPDNWTHEDDSPTDERLVLEDSIWPPPPAANPPPLVGVR